MQKVVLLFLLCLLPSSSQTFEFMPGAKYDPAVPSPQKVLGYELGLRHATHADIVRYFETLAAAAPTRMKVFEYGQTWEGRKLIYAVIASESNLQRIDEIKAGVMKLADPRATAASDAQAIIKNAPVVIGLSYGVHGNEISSPDAAMMTAYHLLASSGDKLVDDVLANVVVLIDPLQNPDGRDRFVNNFRQNEGLEPDPSPVAAERVEPWPGGRSNHYLFDMNRDWFALTQPETKGRVKYLNEWLPLVHVDVHEMGSESTYFFAPGAAPYNPHLTTAQKDQMSWFGKNNARWFDKLGYSYFTREVYDEFYPGYGASWPWYYGGMGMTYENASVRGLVIRRRDDSLYTFQDSVRKHFIASIATCETASLNRQKLLENFWSYTRTAVSEGQSEQVKEYVLPRHSDVSAVDKLAHILAEQGIEVRKWTSPLRVGSTEYPAGSYSISAAQPRKRLVRALLDTDVPMDADFVKEQERRRKRKLGDQIYDVTAWALPMLYNVECVTVTTALQPGNSATLLPRVAPQPASASVPRAEVAYVIPWGTRAAGRFLTQALRADLKLLSANKAFTQNGRKFPSGTLIALVKENAATLHETITRIAGDSGAEVVSTNSSWVDDGINFGSNNVARMKKPSIALLWDTPTSSISAGQTRFVLERQYGYPVTVVRTQSIGTADLSKFDVLIVPSSGPGYANAINATALDRIKTWVRSGGVLIGIGGAVSWLSSPQVGLLDIQRETLAADAIAGAKPAEASKPQTGTASRPPSASATPAPPAGGPVPGKVFTREEEYEKAIRDERELPDAVAGVLLRAKVDPETWVTAGVSETLHVLFDGRNIYTPIKQNRGVNAVIYEGPDKLLASGVLWEENRKQLSYKPFVVLQNEGRGAVIGFTADPNFRAYMDGLNVLFLNAVFRGSAIGGRSTGGTEEMH